MKIIVTYVYPLVGNDHYLNLAIRFLKTYHDFPPGLEHESLVVVNGGKPNAEIEFMFGSLPNLKLMHHDNSGYDCGAYQHAARENPCDLMVFFGVSTYIKGAGWLLRMVQSYQKYGNNLYGVMGNRGNRALGVFPHIRTTGFWLPTELFNQYPHKVVSPQDRYPFEHGRDCLTSWIYRRKLKAYVVTWNGEYLEPSWDSIPNGFHRGNQSALLCGDRNSEPPYFPIP